jgi:hypothetical protein
MQAKEERPITNAEIGKALHELTQELRKLAQVSSFFRTNEDITNSPSVQCRTFLPEEKQIVNNRTDGFKEEAISAAAAAGTREHSRERVVVEQHKRWARQT